MGKAITEIGTYAGTISATTKIPVADSSTLEAATAAQLKTYCATDIAATTHAATGKTTPVDADELPLVDSAASNVLKKLTWSDIKATIKAYFDTVYLSLTGGTLAGGTVTASTPVLTVTQTWNSSGTTFTGNKTNITNTASASASLVEDWQVNSSSIARLKKDGTFSAVVLVGTDGLTYQAGGNNQFYARANAVSMTSGYEFGWSSSATEASTSSDLKLYRDAAQTLAQRNGTNAQTKRVYGTYTDSSNYRRVALSMTTAGVATLTPEGAGTGASGNVLHISGLPTSNPGPGILWNNAGSVAIGT